MNHYIIILLFILLILYLSSNSKCNNYNEDFTSNYAVNNYIYTGRPKNGLNLTDDTLFSNVIVYENDADPYSPNAKLGIEKCVDKCNGQCVEFGITGIGYCFPSNV